MNPQSNDGLDRIDQFRYPKPEPSNERNPMNDPEGTMTEAIKDYIDKSHRLLNAMADDMPFAMNLPPKISLAMAELIVADIRLTGIAQEYATDLADAGELNLEDIQSETIRKKVQERRASNG